MKHWAILAWLTAFGLAVAGIWTDGDLSSKLAATAGVMLMPAVFLTALALVTSDDF